VTTSRLLLHGGAKDLLNLCIADSTGLPDNWANRAYIGMTATTGALADNHDVISLKTYSDLAVLEAEEEEERVGFLPCWQLFCAAPLFAVKRGCAMFW
jgi:hypothetical protein